MSSSRPWRPSTTPSFTLLIVLLVILSGCLAPTGQQSPTDGTAGTTPDGSGFPVTVEHALGETTVSETPERIVVLEWSYTEILLSLGIQPVGVADIEGYEALVATEPGIPETTTDVGTRQEPNLEVIASLDPDLVIGVEFRHEQIHDDLSNLAPTLVFDPWPETGDQLQRLEQTVDRIGQATGHDQAAQDALGELDATIDQGRQALTQADLDDDRFVLSQVLAPQYGQFRLFQDHHAAVEIIQRLGLENAWDGGFGLNGFSTVDVEALDGVQDASFLYVPSSDASIQRFQGNPVWDGLTFVQEERIYNLSGAWLLPGPLSGQAFVDLVVEAMTGVPLEDTGPTTIDHAMGSTTLQSPAERIVALEWTYAEDALAVGVQPVGMADVEGYQRWVKAEPSLGPSVTDVGTRQEPSLETIAQLDPDLIIGVEFRHEPIYDQLSKIAPTLLFDPYPGPEGPDQYTEMTETFTAIAQALGEQDQARSVLADMETRFGQVQDRLAAIGATDQPILLAQAFTQESAPTLRLFTDNAMAAQILDRIGLENAWAGGFETYGFSTVGLEALEPVDDATFLYVAQPDDDPVNTTWSDDPVWQNLTFVQEDRVHALGGDVWLFGGPLSATYLVDATLQTLEADRP